MTTQRRAGLLLFTLCSCSCSALSVGPTPKVSAPKNFKAPEPKPLTVTDLNSLGSLGSGSLALVLRAATGILVTGWKPNLSLSAPSSPNEYSLKLGPLYLTDSSSTTRGEVKRPSEPLVLYEYDASPFCKKVREAAAILDLDVLCKPCPGARKGFSDELFSLSGRRTVPCLVDPSLNGGEPLFESDEIIAHLFDAYGPGRDQVPITLKGTFATLTCGLAAMARGMVSAPAINLPPTSIESDRAGTSE